MIVTALTTRSGNTQDDQQTGQLVTHSLTSEGHDASEDGTGRGTPIIAAPLSHGSNPNSNAAGRRREDDENLALAPPLTGGARQRGGWSGDNGEGSQAYVGQAVRRLTPVECCRLQGFPDDWLAGNEPPDSPKYAALGDAVTVPVIEWIGRRILMRATP